MKKIRIGGSSLHGDILEDYEKAKACNFCTHFKGYGLHACAGHCDYKNEDIGGGYIGNYRKAAKTCGGFDCNPKFLVED